jgi:hypothetical protein
VDLSALPLEPGVLAQRLRRGNALEPEQLEEAGRSLNIGRCDLYSDMVEHT